MQNVPLDSMTVTPPVEPQGASRKERTCRKCSKPMKDIEGDSDQVTDAAGSLS